MFKKLSLVGLLTLAGSIMTVKAEGITVPTLPFDDLSTAVLAAVAIVVTIGFGLYAAPYGIRFAKKIWGVITK